jgi:hypothetical protein
MDLGRAVDCGQRHVRRFVPDLERPFAALVVPPHPDEVRADEVDGCGADGEPKQENDPQSHLENTLNARRHAEPPCVSTVRAAG